MTGAGTTSASRRSAPDILSLPALRPKLRWRHLRAFLQSLSLLFAILVVFDGLTGSPVAPRNLAGVLPWIQWRGLTVLSLLAAGSLFCAACPFVLVRNAGKALFPADRPWPRLLRGKWLAAALLAAYFWFYEAFDPWALPWLTACVTTAYIVGAFLVDSVFRGAAFCKYLCPIGQFNFVNSTCSPLEVRVRDAAVCRRCTTKDCIVGGGCELFLFQQQKVGNLDCTFCMDCVHACPHGNVGLLARAPARELWDTRKRSGFGVLQARTDVAFLAATLVFAAFLNAFGMVGPFRGFERAVMGALGLTAEWAALAVVFFCGLVLAPTLLIGLASWLTKLLARRDESVTAIATRFAFSLVPLGFGMWAAHYGFHFFTGALTIIPVFQEFAASFGAPLLGNPRWDLGPILPAQWVLPAELLFLEVGLLASLVTAHRIAVELCVDRGSTVRAFLPWALLALLLFAAGVWLMFQPMEMRGTMSAG